MDIPGYNGQLAWLPARTIVLTRHGSHAYGLNTPTSDLDIKGVAIPPREYLLGCVQRFEQAETKEPDMVVYELRKFLQLASDCNPNIIEVLFTDPADYLGVTPLGERLLAARSLFVSRKARFTFSGYAMAQLKRLQHHYRWVRDPPAAPPSREALGLDAHAGMPREQRVAALAEIDAQVQAWEVDLSALGAVEQEQLRTRIAEAIAARTAAGADATWTAAARVLNFDADFVDLLRREREFRAQQRAWEQYLAWRNSRNARRAELEARFGYDTKFAMHVVRLLRMAREILETGQVVVRRPDRDELLAVRNGAWPFDQLVAWATAQDAALEALYRATTLPQAANRKAIDALCIELIEQSLRTAAL